MYNRCMLFQLFRRVRPGYATRFRRVRPGYSRRFRRVRLRSFLKILSKEFVEYPY